MASVKIHEGKKIETTIELADDEGIIFTSPEKNLIKRQVSQGCLKGTKQWMVNIVITNKRVITIPHQPNKKNYPVESYYWNDISEAVTIKLDQEAAGTGFSIKMKPGQKSSCSEGGMFMVAMAMTAGNMFKALKASSAQASAQSAHLYAASFRAFDEAHFTKKSLDKYYDNMIKRTQEKAKNMDFSNTGHHQIRDHIVDVINECVATVNEG